MEINLQLSAKDVIALDDFLGRGIGLLSATDNTYVLKKLLYNLVRHLPADHDVTITTQKIENEPIFGYVYAKPTTAEKKEG
jgi:hypothetical protein